MMHKAKERCPIDFQGRPSNFKVTGDKKIADFDPNWAFPDCNSSLTSTMDLMMHKAWCSIEEVHYCFPRSSIKLQGHTGWKIDGLNPIFGKKIDGLNPIWDY